MRGNGTDDKGHYDLFAGICSDTFVESVNKNGLGGIGQAADVNTATKCRAACISSATTCYGYDFDNNVNKCFIFTNANYKMGTGVASGVNHYKRNCQGLY